MIEPLNKNHINQVVELHLKVNGKSTVNGRLGPKHLTKIYQVITSSNLGFGFVSITNGKITGFITGTFDTEGFYKVLLNTLTFFEKLKMLAMMIRYPLFFLEMVEAKIQPWITKEKILASLTSWIVDKGQPHSGLTAMLLLKKALSHLHKSNVLFSLSGVRKNDLQVNGIYQRLGAKNICSLITSNTYAVNCNPYVKRKTH